MMENNIYGRYKLDLKWENMLKNSNLEQGLDYYIRKEGVYLNVPTDTKKLEDFITRLFSITE